MIRTSNVRLAPCQQMLARLLPETRLRAFALPAIVCLLFCARPAMLWAADGVTPPASQRYASSNVAEVPDFQQHVVPLLGRLGCNGRACHGSFQGRGGFRLSLFGYDFEMDHEALADAAESEQGSRIDRASPGESLIVRKPSLQTDHEGGQRFEVGSWEHRLLTRWIESGASGVSEPRELERLEIIPREIVFAQQPATMPLRVIAHWIDGSREDVTPLCRFRSNDDSVADVDRDGRVRSVGTGDTHVVAFYDNGVAAVPVMKPRALLADDDTSQHQSTTKVDELIESKLHKLGIVPSELCSDAEFLRRVSIDLTGTLPTPQEIEQFLSDTRTDKRARKIDELLDRPAYAAWWANKLCDFTGCNPSQQAELGQDTAVQWYMWIYARLRENVPYDELVERIVLAKGRRQGQSYEDYAREFTAYYRDQTQTRFAQRETMPHYWSRKTLEKPEDKALALAHNFLGIRLQCAQCHKHPFAAWTRQDFDQLSQLLASVSYGVPEQNRDRYRDLARRVGLNVRGENGSPVRSDVFRRAGKDRTLPWREIYIDRREQETNVKLLRSRMVHLGVDEDPRESIMQWMKQPDNPWFARALVNRVWAAYFHVGIVEPPDDINSANPPSHPALLNYLSERFVENNFDMKWLHREIVSSDAYQRSWRPNKTNRQDRRNYSRNIPRRIPAEIVYDGVKQALAGSDQLEEVRTDLSRRAIGHLSMRLSGTYAMQVFGKPERAVNCDCERVNHPTLLQSVFMQNDPLVDQRLSESQWLGEMEELEQGSGTLDRAALVREAWLRALGRPPNDAERSRAEKHLSGAESVSEGMRDLMWALINTKEFILNR